MTATRSATFVLSLLVCAAMALVMPASAPAVDWVLALPPSKDTVPAGRDPRKAVGGAFDRDAPITSWSRGPAYESGAACEDARLQAIRDFDAAAEGQGDREPSSEERTQLATAGRRAFGRCVPAFAFDANHRATGRRQ